jgi:hypothetical protein
MEPYAYRIPMSWLSVLHQEGFAVRARLPIRGHREGKVSRFGRADDIDIAGATSDNSIAGIVGTAPKIGGENGV